MLGLSRQRFLGIAKRVGAIGGVLGAVAYVLLSILCTFVYSPLGIGPADVGLTNGELLVRTAVGVAGVVVVTVAGSGLIALTAWGIKRSPWFFGGSVLALPVSLVAAALLGGWLIFALTGVIWLLVFFTYATLLLIDPEGPLWHQRWWPFVSFGFLVLVIVVGTLVGSAAGAVERMEHGRRPGDLMFGVPAPWAAQVVRLEWTSSSLDKPSLPRCLLYLGESNGTSIFYDATPDTERTIRLPTSMVIIEILPKTTDATPESDNVEESDEEGPCA